ncbi:MAG TPA: Asp-tRNA(Asn)/Glu-tRNA(Gln) amidotransferase subunit GatC [Candidatus Binatia bacterium]|jgi:aspartyl-tRNA(Asn)/glutamyl-tRNA(Gln) amidotransferase subunit C|nr:Asp-tRNA(Asn)/Glu-tRNA(Gln) amidotransferase subunit GatC [Candidatus Binatia bacterium]
MKLTPEQVDHIATLSRLSLTDEERVRFAEQLSSVLEYVDALAKVDTAGVEPMNHSIALMNVFGADEPAPCDAATRAALLDRFPEREGDLLKVKAVFS